MQKIILISNSHINSRIGKAFQYSRNDINGHFGWGGGVGGVDVKANNAAELSPTSVRSPKSLWGGGAWRRGHKIEFESS